MPVDDSSYGSYDPDEELMEAAPLPSPPGEDVPEVPDVPAEEPPPSVPETPPVEFDQRWRQDFTGLLFLGALTKTFDWLGHKFRIRTLTQGELLEVALVTSEYAGTLGAAKAYATAVVAASITHVDGQPLPAPLTNQKGDTHFSNRFTYVSTHYFPPTIDRVYGEYIRLEEKVRQVIDAMGEASG